MCILRTWSTLCISLPLPNFYQRTRNDGNGDDDGSEDNVSLVSRTPSPPPPDAMEIDKYDEYYTRRPQREVITVETKIKSSNIGFSMLAKMGWVEGTPLGLSGEGVLNPAQLLASMLTVSKAASSLSPST